jgi:RecA-family ATPase
VAYIQASCPASIFYYSKYERTLFRKLRAKYPHVCRARGNENYYASDYETIKAVQALASETHIAIMVIHHVRKGAADNDPIDKISGTLGLSSGADSLLILDRDSNGATLYGRGRDIEEMDRALAAQREPLEFIGELIEDSSG